MGSDVMLQFKMVNHIIALALTVCVLTGCKNAEDYFSEGQNLSNEGYYKSAIVKFDKAIIKNPYQKDAYIQMGLSYAYLNMHDSALWVYGRLLLLYPENTAANYYSGLSKYKQQKYAGAVVYFNNALDSKGGFNASDTNSIQALIDVCKDNFESENAEEDIPTREILFDRAMANFMSRNILNARKDFSDCIFQNFNPGTSYYMIGLCRLARREIKYAREAFLRASNYGDSLALKKLNFLETTYKGNRSSARKKT
jgi:tetratricopeptide (TPR) repeat protein